jgi:hypothetical protein
VRDLVKTASSDANDDPQIGSTLFKLLIPIDLESFLTGGSEIQIELDDETAGIPWELLDDGNSSLEPWAIRSKLLRKLRLENYRSNVRDADGEAHARRSVRRSALTTTRRCRAPEKKRRASSRASSKTSGGRGSAT